VLATGLSDCNAYRRANGLPSNITITNGDEVEIPATKTAVYRTVMQDEDLIAKVISDYDYILFLISSIDYDYDYSKNCNRL